jgi:hypothetical protein
MPENMLMTPSALNQLVLLGAVRPETLTRRCCHRELRGDVWQCPRPAMVICGACGNGTCLDAYHAYGWFCTLRDAQSLFDRAGSKFFYRCESCHDFLCVNCLGIADDYPCEPSQLENYRFRCTTCGGLVRIIRTDGVDHVGVVEVLADWPSRMLQVGNDATSG